MPNRNYLTSDFQRRRLFAGQTTLSTRKTKALLARWSCVAILMLLILSLSGCAWLCPTPETPPEQSLPRMPALTEPLPEISYSLRVQQKLQTWREKLTDTPPTSEH